MDEKLQAAVVKALRQAHDALNKLCEEIEAEKDTYWWPPDAEAAIDAARDALILCDLAGIKS